MGFEGNPFDGDTLGPQLAQVERIISHKPEPGIIDRGYKGKKQINGIQIYLSRSPLMAPSFDTFTGMKASVFPETGSTPT